MSLRTRVLSRYVALLVALVGAGGLITHDPRVAAQASPISATLTRWDIFAATGGTSTASTNATQNPNGITRNPNDGTIWFTAQRPSLRLGWLNPTSNSYVEWNPLPTSSAPAGLTLHPASGDVWLTTGADPEVLMKIGGTNTFRRFELPVTGSATFTKTHRLAVTADGSAAFVAIPQNGTLTGVIRITRGATNLGVARGVAVPVAAQHWRLPNQLDNPRHLALDGRDIVWLTNARDNTLYRIDPATNQFKRWTLAAGTAPAGLHITNGADGFAQKVCVVSEGNPSSPTGVVQCMTTALNTSGGNDFSVFTRPTSLAFAFPQQVAANAAGELFLTEKHNDSLTFIDDTAQALVTVVSRTPASGTLTKTTPVVNTSDPADVTPVALAVTPTVTAVVGVEDPTGPAGHVRYALPPLPPVVGSLLARPARPIGVTPVVEGAPGAPGAVFVSESFDVTNAEQRMGAVISRFAPGESATVIQATPASLTFSRDVGTTSPASQMIALEKLGGGDAPWTATKTQPWLTLAPSSGATPSTLTVSASAGSLAVGTYTDTITVTGGTSPIAVPVTFDVVQRPEMVVTPSSLFFTAVNTDTTPPAPKTFAISSQGGGTLEWTATVNVPGVSVLLEVPGQAAATSISGTGPAVVTVHIGSVPGTQGLREGTVTITSSNASNPTATIDIDYDITIVTQLLLVDDDSLAFEVVLGGDAPAPQVVNVINASGQGVTWGVIFPYTEAPPLPAWLDVTPEVAAAGPKQSIPMTVSIDPSGLTAPGTYAATMTIDDHTGNSPPAVVGVLVTVRAAAIQFVEDTLTIPTNTTGGPTSQTVTLTNPGDAPLVFTPVVTMNNGAGWLTVTPTGELTLAPGGSLPFTVTTNPAGLAPGTYTGQITVANPFSANGSDTVFITMVVDAAPDTTAPVISGAVDAAAEATGPSGAAVSYTLPTALDDRDGARAVSCVPAPGTTFSIGTTTVTCTASDTAGNTATATLTVTVTDTTPPAISGAANVTAAATGGSGAAVTFSPTASDLVDGSRPVSCTPAPGSTFPVGDTTVTCTAADTRGNTASATFVVTVTPTAADTTPPSITAPASQTLEATGPAGAIATFAATATDDSGTPTIAYSHQPGSTFPLGTTTVTATASDGAGNTASAGFTIAVRDTTPPVIAGATPITVAATGPSGAVVTFALTASDLVSGSPTVACTPASGSTFPVGATTVNCSSSDAAGNTATASFLVTVTAQADTAPPSVNVPGNMTLEAAGPSGSVATFATSAFDAVSGALTPACTPPSGSAFPLGTTTVTCTATDAAGNTGSASFTITVRDTTPPSVTAPPDQTVQSTGPVPVSYPPATATDLAGPVTLTYSHPSGSTFPLGATTVTVTATDGAGHVATATFTITVNQPADTTPPVISAPAGQVLEATSPAGASATFSASASDNSGAAPTITYSHASGSTFPLGVTTVTVTARDEAGNTATATFTITVRDTIAPALNGVPANFTVQTAAASTVVTYAMPTASDIVDTTPTVVCTPASGSSLASNATHTIACTATDDSGNVSSASFQVTVQRIDPYTLTPASGLYFKTGRLAYCNGLPVGPNWKDQGFVVANNTATPLSYTITGATSWVKVEPASGTIAGSSSSTLVVSVDLSGLGRGVYQGSFTLTAGGVPTVVPVTLEIGNALPTLCLTPSAVVWGQVKGGTTLLTKYYDVLNVGDDPMGSWSSSKTITDGTLTLSTTSATGPKLQIGATVKTGKRKGNQLGQVTITVPGAQNGQQTIDLQWTVQ